MCSSRHRQKYLDNRHVRFGPLAHICSANRHVCLGPIADIPGGASPISQPVAGTAFSHQRTQRGFGSTVLIEIRRREPLFQDFADLWPFVVKDRVPSRISISALEDHVVVENALKAEAKSASCRTGSSI